MTKTRNNPTVSVVIPTYNRAHLIGRAIQSVLDQTYQDFEIIVVDDGSRDNTCEVINDFDDERIRYIRHQGNRGGAVARNTGIKAARGEYTAFQDSDDEWLPEKLKKQMEIFKNVSSKVGVVYTGFWKLGNNKKIYKPQSWVTQKEGDIHKELLNGNFVTTQSAVVKKTCFRKTGMFDERLPCLQDWELWIRISKYYHFKCIDEPLLVSYYTPDSIYADKDARIVALELILEKHFGDFKKNRRSLASYQYSIGNLLRENGKTSQAKGYFLRALKSYPLNSKYLVGALVLLFGENTYNRVVRLKRKIQSKDGNYGRG
ncbi:MAG TPA: glycosyltransferase family 2 protein [bacterium]|nr:glycosyltransferase family 2 protein [bacterium]